MDGAVVTLAKKRAGQREQDWYTLMGVTLRGERRKRGWTIYDVAALCDVSGVAVSRWERGLDRMKAWPYEVMRREGLLP